MRQRLPLLTLALGTSFPRQTTVVLLAHTQPQAEQCHLIECVRSKAENLAKSLDLSIQSVTFQHGTLQVLASGGGLDALQSLNNALSQSLDEWEVTDDVVKELPPFLLEVSSPGLSDTLTSEEDFQAFRGFEVTVSLAEEFKKKLIFQGTLVERGEEFLRINNKGRITKIPLDIVSEVRLPSAKAESA